MARESKPVVACNHRRPTATDTPAFPPLFVSPGRRCSSSQKRRQAEPASQSLVGTVGWAVEASAPSWEVEWSATAFWLTAKPRAERWQPRLRAGGTTEAFAASRSLAAEALTGLPASSPKSRLLARGTSLQEVGLHSAPWLMAEALIMPPASNLCCRLVAQSLDVSTDSPKAGLRQGGRRRSPCRLEATVNFPVLAGLNSPLKKCKLCRPGSQRVAMESFFAGENRGIWVSLYQTLKGTIPELYLHKQAGCSRFHSVC